MSWRGRRGCYRSVVQSVVGLRSSREWDVGPCSCHTDGTVVGDHEGVSDDYDIDTYGVWDPIGNPHSDDCLCSNCGPTEYALNVQAEAERRADERERNYKSIALNKAIREHREKWDAKALAEEDRWRGISYRLAMGLEVSPEAKRWHDRVLAERRERYARTKGES